MSQQATDERAIREQKMAVEIAREELRHATRHLNQAAWHLRKATTEEIATIVTENLATISENIRSRIGRRDG